MIDEAAIYAALSYVIQGPQIIGNLTKSRQSRVSSPTQATPKNTKMNETPHRNRQTQRVPRMRFAAWCSDVPAAPRGHLFMLRLFDRVIFTNGIVLESLVSRRYRSTRREKTRKTTERDPLPQQNRIHDHLPASCFRSSPSLCLLDLLCRDFCFS